MRRYIDANMLKDKTTRINHIWNCTTNAEGKGLGEIIDDIPSADVVEVVRCKDCKHRPIDTQEEGNGFDYEFPEEYGCPGYCDDGYYSQRFKDDFYCAWGERAEE